MKPDVQFILDENKKPAFAVLAMHTYQKLVAQKNLGEDLPLSPPLLSEDGLQIRLPNGGPGAHIDLVRLADYGLRAALVSIAINGRQQSLEKFPQNQIASLDPMLRMCFLPEDSPYKNTMQATTEVVDALVESGLFTRSKRRFDGYYRPVNALDFVRNEAIKLTENRRTENPIEVFYWMSSYPSN